MSKEEEKKEQKKKLDMKSPLDNQPPTDKYGRSTPGVGRFAQEIHPEATLLTLDLGDWICKPSTAVMGQRTLYLQLERIRST